MTGVLIASGYCGVSAAAWVLVGGWQRAVLDGPRYEKRRKHLAKCDFCEEPGWFWTTGYRCGRGSYEGAYPFTLSPWFRLFASLFWPCAIVGSLLADATTAIARIFAPRVAAHDYAEQDRREVERLVKEL